MIYEKPEGWREVDVQSFKDFLRVCNDYVADSYSNARCYMWRHNDQRFAIIVDGKVYVDPKLLEIPGEKVLHL